MPKSTFWTSVLKIIHLLQDNSFYQIARGKVSIWSSPWCATWKNIRDHLIIQPVGFSYPALIKDLWLPNTKNWNTPLIDSLFLQPTASAIKQINIIPTDEDDILCWKLTPNGKCNSKSTYKLCLQALYDAGSPKSEAPNQPVVGMLKKVWENKQVLPRIKAFAWRLLRKAIPTGEKGSRYSKHISKLCCRCGF
jgi:hypothetical protein